MIAEVALNLPLRQTFTYLIPPELGGAVQAGHLARVPFRTGQMPAVVVAVRDESPTVALKPLGGLIDPAPVLTLAQIDLARWLSDALYAPVGMCLWLWLPPGIEGHRDTRYTLTLPDAPPADPLEERLIALLRRRGALRLRQIRAVVPDDGLEGALAALARRGVLAAQSVLTPPTVRPQTVQTASLAIHPRAIPEVLRHLGRRSRRADLLETVAYFAQFDPAVEIRLALSASGSTRATLRRLADEERLVVIEGDRVRLAIPPDAVDECLLRLRQGETDLHILRVLAREDKPLDVSWLYAQTGAKLSDLKRLAERGLLELGEKATWRDSLAQRDFVPALAPRLTAEQAAAWEQVRQAQQPGYTGARVFLLHGVTGSGKTEVYLRAIGEALAQGRQAIFLVPEIALTAQTVRRVAARFPGRVGVIHSRLSDGERYDTWRRAREGRVSVIVGARSALYAPLPDVGLIVIDEEHDASYTHFSTPHYDTRRVAEQMMRVNRGVVLLGSATPDLTTAYRAQRGEIVALRLPDRIMGHRVRVGEHAEREGVTSRYQRLNDDALTIDLPPVQVVDMRAELRRGNTSIFSEALRAALTETLARAEQAILFINRRGTASYVFCRDCGAAATCTHCDTPLTYHASDDRLRCHHCGAQQVMPRACPACGSARIRQFGAGTQQVESALEALYPQARVVRWDADTASNPEMHDVILSRFLRREADFMVGTQMVAKGLDLPRVTLVGIVSADIALALPDFRAGERAFQLLTQVAGRAGRGVLGGRVILQTYQPDHYAIRSAAAHDYAGFYAHEIAYRQALGYPPFRRLARFLFTDPSEARARQGAQAVAARLRAALDTLHLTESGLIGPAPCFFSRLNDQYRWHVILRSPDPLWVLSHIPEAAGWQVEIDPQDVL